MSGAVSETYVAAIQHGLADLDGGREPPRTRPAVNLLRETKQRAGDLQLQGLCEEGAHNAAWDETNFESRYLDYLAEDEDAQRELDELAGRVADGEHAVLVCFESDRKRCHRTLLRDRFLNRIETA